MMKQKLLYYIAFGTFVIIMGIVYSHKAEHVDIKIEDDRDSQQEAVTSIREQEDPLMVHEEDEKNTIIVHICGAVKNEGVYEVEEGARVFDALALAGGLVEDAATDYVNLAREIQDGEQITFPTEQQIEDGAFETKGEASDYININTASASELMELSGVGESRAELIVTYRKENGPFQSKEDIMLVSGIKEGLFQKIKDFIIVK
ncbi:helix-hairpin-helix domain-containing protein [Vallitalea pronyensis]|uniref:Helix-hairpin-helix domain-containing protein n=1 Tax=Vallitalea pronyensis TaxID=1348613 RepID=A0A8J8MLT7_9FIRM|nr:helix-hairpin-helix domain-containing protein [Vallitalea pronyensis]QUI23889.1 helix-hairpin-helix domain-containing protein [Vallitalea pronyensis]